MIKSISTHTARQTQRKASEQNIWRWPQQRVAGQPTPDYRLLNATIAGLNAEITLADGRIVQAGVRAVSQHDLVLEIPCLTVVPVQGQVAEVSLSSKQWSVVSRQKCIVHWGGNIHGENVVAMFTVNALGAVVEQWTYDQSRGEVRFPVDLPVIVKVDEERQIRGRMLDYSLNGCRFLCQEEIPLDQQYSTQVLFSTTSIEIGVQPRWVLNTGDGFQMGCTFQAERGVLLSCRHHEQNTELESPLKPQTTNWEGEADEEVEVEW